MNSWRNIKWDGNETLHEFSYRVTQLGKTIGLNDQHILDTFKLGLPSNIYVNLVHIDGMQATLNMAKRLMAVSKGPSPGASAISNIPFMVATSHDGLPSGNCQKPDIPKQVTFQDSALLCGLQNINKKLCSLDNDLYALRAGRNERSRRGYKSSRRQNIRNRNMSSDNSRDSSRDSQDRDRRNVRSCNRSRNKSRKNSGDRSNDRNGRARIVEMILDKNPTGIVNIVIKMIILGNTAGRCKPMLRKPEGLRRWMIEMMTYQTLSTPW